MVVLWSLAAASGLAYVGDLRASASIVVLVMLLWGAGVLALPLPRWSVGRWVAVAALLRVVLLATEPSLSDDIYRYVWEGTLTAEGGNPYLHAPADPALTAWAHNENRLLVNHPTVSSIYPPFAMLLFSALARLWDDPLWFRFVAASADTAIVAVLARVLRGRGLSTDGAARYALLPLGAVESASSGHLDLIAQLCLVAAIATWDRRRGGVIWLGIGALLKLLPGVLLLGALRRPRQNGPTLLLIAILALCAALPFWEAGPTLVRGLGTYTAHWSFNGSVYPVMAAILGEYARPLLVAVGAVISVWAVSRRTDPAEAALWIGGAFVLLSPTVHPWYVGWAWLPALICGVRAWTLLAALMPLSYIALTTLDPRTGQWSEAVWPRVVIYLPFFALLVRDNLSRFHYAGGWWRKDSPI